jgi:hypothetical protein
MFVNITERRDGAGGGQFHFTGDCSQECFVNVNAD